MTEADIDRLERIENTWELLVTKVTQIDETVNQTKGGLDQINKRIEQTNKQVNETNEKIQKWDNRLWTIALFLIAPAWLALLTAAAVVIVKTLLSS